MALAIALAGFIVLGAAVALLFSKELRINNRLEWWSVSFGLGVGSLALLQFYQVVMFGRMSIVFIVCAIFVLSLAAFTRRVRSIRLQETARPEMGRLTIAELLLAGYIVAVVAAVGITALSGPMESWDGRAIWGLKAKILFEKKTFLNAEFFDPGIAHPHQSYPLLVPLAESWIYSFLGYPDDRLVKSLFLLFFVALTGYLFAKIRDKTNRRNALLFTALFGSLASFTALRDGGVASGYADIPLAYFVIVMVLSSAYWLETGKLSGLILAAAFSAFAMFTKNEGIGLFAVNTIALCGARVYDRKQSSGRDVIIGVALFAFIALALIGPWLVFRSNLPMIDENYAARMTVDNLAAGVYRLPVIFAAFLGEAVRLRLWGPLWLLFTFSLLLVRKRFSIADRYVFAFLAMATAMYVFIFMITPWDVGGQIRSSLTRLTIHIAPVAVFFTATRLTSRENTIGAVKRFT